MKNLDPLYNEHLRDENLLEVNPCSREDFTGECASEDESEEDDDDNSDEEDEVETSRRSLRIKHLVLPHEYSFVCQ